MKNRSNQFSRTQTKAQAATAAARRLINGIPSLSRDAQSITNVPVPAIRNQNSKIQNGFGFWELKFLNQHATLPQSAALFYIACLFQNPSTEPLSPNRLDTLVCDTFGDHPDLLRWLPSVCARGDQTEMLKLLRRREQALYKIVDSPDALDPVKEE